MLTITKIFHFEAAHRISNYGGPCQNIHGHSYQLHVSLSGSQTGQDDMLIDFKTLKRIVQENIIQPLDHVLLLKKNEKNLKDFEGTDTPIFWMDDEPTAEQLILWISRKLSPFVPENVFIRNLRLYETESSYVDWEADKPSSQLLHQQTSL